MQRFYHILLVTFILPLYVVAQQPDTTEFTLQQCIEYARKNSVSLKNALVDEQIAKARVKETRGIGLPQIDGTVQLVHNPRLARFYAVYSPEGFLIPNPPPAGTNPGDVLAGENFFQLKNSGDASITVSQIIFNGSYIVGLQAANAYKDLSVKATEQTQEQLVENVTKAYYAVLINNERMKLFESNITRVDSLLKTTQALHQNGFAESIDVDRTKVAFNNLLTERDKFANFYELSVALLKFQMNYPMDKSIRISTLDLETVTIPTSADSVRENWSYSNRADYRVLEAQQKLQILDTRNKYAASLPSLVAFANWGYSTQSNSIKGIFKTETNLTENHPAFGPDKWYQYSRVGLSLNVPIFSGLQRNYRLQQSKLNMLKIENSFTQLKSGIDLQIEQASVSYKNALKTLETQRSNIELASNVARVTKIKYTEGVGSSLEVTDAESSLREAQINYYNSLLDALIASVDLDKALGKLGTTQTGK